MDENEWLLQDRLGVIRDVVNKYGEDNFYISFSGGKDSTLLHYLVDMALPNNKIPRVYVNTGIEYNYILQFVRQLQKNDERIKIINSNINIKKMLEEKGYPFKSKEHSLRVEQFNKGHNSNFIKKYLGMTNYEGKYMCPKILLYQFEQKGKYNFSNKCCYELKKKPFHNYEKNNNKQICITGMRADEGGNRERLDCVIKQNGKIKKFHPLIKVSEYFEDWFIKKYNIQLCVLYYEPYNFKRTGCKGCPYALTLQEQLETMARLLPNERKQCELLWKPVYEEYRRIGYRLKNNEQIKIL